jgi:hypothetical protein
MLQENLKNRIKMITHLRDEVMGPFTDLEKHGQELPYDEGKKKWLLPEQKRRLSYVTIDDELHEVIGPEETPIQKYGVGILHCTKEETEVVVDDRQHSEDHSTEEIYGSLKSAATAANETERKLANIEEAFDTNEDSTVTTANETLSGTNLRDQTTMGLSFQIDLDEGGELLITLDAARYVSLPYVTDLEQAPKWWRRQPISIQYKVSSKQLKNGSIRITKKQLDKKDQDQLGRIDLELSVFARPIKRSPSQLLLTVCFINRTPGSTLDIRNACSLFQTEFQVETKSGKIYPYTEASLVNPSEEEESLDLLYSNQPIFASGHGCSADWGETRADNPFIRKTKEGVKEVNKIIATPFPCYELANISAEIKSGDKVLTASMEALGGLNEDDDGIDDLTSIIEGYDQWIDANSAKIESLNPRVKAAAERHMEECRGALKRMRQGLDLLKSNEDARIAFKYANEAVYIQQKRAGSTRKWQGDPLTLNGTEEDFFKAEDRIGKWRPFQIAFILMNLRSMVDGEDPFNENVELIWFPTGGGKTEAYLGLAAFAIIFRRLKDPNDTGTQVLMRYTLRLLTSQQFQRASGLVCALDFIRQREQNTLNLGNDPISIGLWVGGSNTPNTNEAARTALTQASNPNNPYQFVLQRCPWCGAQIGPVPISRTRSVIKGIIRAGNEVRFKCGNSDCRLSSGIPVTVIDEQIYTKPPTILIGTVDKFASLAWKPEIRNVFGIDENGERKKSPPNLIIQDELHLITGPLGTVCSTYETIIEELCTDHRNGTSIKPKIVSATATTRNYRHQIEKLYGRKNTPIFPPPGLDSADSYFASSERDKDGVLTPGRIHVGLFAPSYSSVQTANVRAFSSLLNTPSYFNDKEKDPWWTLLIFHNSIKELGGSLTLCMGDIPERMAVLRKRLNRLIKKPDGNFEYEHARFLNHYRIKELTSRIRNDEVPKAIDDLETPYNPDKNLNEAFDVCLASSIIEVGVDIQRLSVMAIVGQPKTTAQYIQVAGRVGRDRNKPGLVLTQYAPSKPRDRSHFEKFRSYHERLYSMVEPASLTPFTPSSVQKTLPGIIAAYLRQTKDSNSAQRPTLAAKHLDECFDLIRKRCNQIAPDELSQLDGCLEEMRNDLQGWDKQDWNLTNQMGENTAQLRRAGSPYHPNWEHLSWPTMNSMRSVDAECRAEICQEQPPSQ